MSHSPMTDYVRLSPNRNAPRKQPIRKITIHHMAGDLTVEQCGALFARPERRASSNYGIGSDGRVGCYVEEEDRSWCSSSPDNDHQAVTIEVANDENGGQWHVSDKAMETLIALCVDICRRNGIPALRYTGDKSGTLTMHCWFAATACPGPYLKSRFPAIAAEVNRRLAADPKPTEGPAAPPPANPNDRADWAAAGNDFTVTASRGDRPRLKAVCDALALPVRNAEEGAAP